MTIDARFVFASYQGQNRPFNAQWIHHLLFNIKRDVDDRSSEKYVLGMKLMFVYRMPTPIRIFAIQKYASDAHRQR